MLTKLDSLGPSYLRIVEVSANTMARRVLIHKRQEESPVQQDSVASVSSNFKSLTAGSLFQALSTVQFGKSFLVIVNSIPSAQQNLRHDYIKTPTK